MPAPNIPEVNILSSPKKMLIYVGIGTLLIGALYAYFINDYIQKDEPDAKLVTVIWICGPLYLAAIIWGINRAFIPKPVIQLKPDYISWGYLGGPENMFPWDEIAKFEMKPGSERQIGVFLKNPEKYFDDKMKRGQGNLVQKYGTHIFISSEVTQASAEEILPVLNNYLDVVNGKPGAKLSHRFH
jgi:hypothetical protein